MSTIMDIETYDSKSLGTLPVMLEQNSLQELLNISGSPTQRSDVRTIIICTHHISRNSQEGNGITDTHDYSNGDSDTEYFDADPDDVATIAWVDQGAYRSCLRDQEKFTSGLDLTYLTNAMKPLPNCKKICISNAYAHLGSAQLEEKIGTQLCNGFHTYSRYSKRFIARVFKAALLAIFGSDMKATELDICLGLKTSEINSLSPSTTFTLTATSC